MQINPLVKKYWRKVTELYNTAYNNCKQEQAHNAMSKLNIFTKVGKLFFELILTKLSLNIGQYHDALSDFLGKELCLAGLRVQYFLGFVLCKELQNISGFDDLDIIFRKGISEVVDKNNQVSTLNFDVSKEGNFNSSLTQHAEEVTEKQINNQSLNSSDIDITLDEVGANNSTLVDFTFDDLGGEDHNSDILVNQIPEVQQYLMKLPKATTELSYLCQHMKWHQPIFSQKRSPINDIIYIANVEVAVKLKNEHFQMSSECQGAISKKQARRIASLYLLRKIYNRFPEVWNKFSLIRSKNEGLQQNLTANNEDIFSKAKLNSINLDIFLQKEEENKQTKMDDIENYLSSLKSYKNQINLLNGKYKQLSAPSIKKQPQDQLGLWPITCEISYGEYIFQAKAKQTNKKKAEQKCSRQILSKIYHKHEKLFDDFRKYKDDKGL